ncbi:lamin tail domain-containing protein, partial [Candidatus Neomarinimicrobiota bacterium]
NWTFSGINALDGETTNATATTPFPTGIYSYTVSVETSPSVSSTSPSDSEADVLINSDIIINFSEDVNVAGAWYSISGSSSGGHTAVVSGGPADFTLNPDVDFNAGETITATVYAASVNDLDSDDPPDNMDVDYIFTFATAVPVSGWIINEIHADPAGDISGDANGDGTRHATDDEFVEIVNNTGSSVDISGWTLTDEVGMRHTFPASTVIPDQSTIIVFGGGTPTGTFGYAIVQTASTGSLGLNNSGDTVTLNNGTTNVAVESYGGEGGDNQSLTRDPDMTGSFVKHSVATGSGGVLFSPGAMIDGSPFPGAVIPPALLEIFEIQGAGLISPYVGQNVITESNVVTVLGTNGFFMQTPTARTDADASTSDGIFVFTGGTPTVSSGDLINVTADVVEFYEFTELSSPVITTLSSGATLPNPVVFDATVPSPGAPQASIEYERFEGMLISIEDGTVTGPNQRFSTDIVAEVHIVAGPNRTFRETGLEYPGLGAPIPTWDGNPEIFELDPDKLGLPNIMIPAGSSFSADGVLGFEYGDYELWPYALDVVENTIPKPLRIPSAGERTIGSLNLYRLFDDADDGGEYVASTAEYDRRLSKFSMYIRNVLKSPDILAVQEVEKLGVLEDLATKILADDASIDYTAYLEEGNDIGGIDVGFLVREDRVQVDGITQLGKAETFIDPGDQSVDILHDRPPLLLEGYFIVAGEPIYPIAVIGVHNRSLSSIETIRVQTKRLTQAQYIAQVAQDMQVANPDIHLVVTGDFNGFEFTDGYVDVIGQIMGDIIPAENVLSGPDLVDPNLTNQVLSLPASNRYSFIYRGSAQVLDHALTTTALNPAVTEFAYGRGNADAAVDLINFDSTPLRSSDHDGLLLYLDVTPPEIILDEPRQLWSVNHKYKTIELSDIILSATDESQLPAESAYITKVTSDELEDDKGKGDGNTLDDIAIIDCQTVDLRAERNGTGNGRVYTIHIAIEDLYGNIGNAAYQVLVPHNKKSEAIDDGPIYEVVADCSAPEALISDEVGVNDSEIIGLTIPDNYSINQNYPNPFNPTTTIQYNLPETNFVSIIVYDMLGRQIKTLVNKQVSAGYHSVKWGATDDQGRKVSTGMYIYSIKVGSFVQTRKMVIMK